MSEQEIKVYELAKELGLDSLSLVDQLNKMNIAVKSHMSSLGNEQVEKVRTALGKKVKMPSPASSSKATRSASTAVRKKRTAPQEPTATTASSSPAEGTASATGAPIIRRRNATSETTILRPTPAIEVREHEVEAPSHEEEESTPTLVATANEILHEEVVVEETPVEAPPEVEAPSEVEAAPPAPVVEKKAPTPPPRVLSVMAPKVPEKRLNVISGPVAPKRIAPRTADRTSTGPLGVVGADASGAPRGKIIKMNKESLDRLAEEEAAKKRPGGARDPGAPEEGNYSDYRKKEMIFLPRRKRIPIGKELRHTEITVPKAHKRVVEIDGSITVGELANQLGAKANEVIRKLIKLGHMVTVNQALDVETATLIATEYQFEVKNVTFNEAAVLATVPDNEDAALSIPRPPVVTIMGHVDHGKTSLLDAIKDTNVAGKEAGGITQHIGAYTIERNGKKITFIDTPGHEAFSVMRARGANVTDIVVLVVAADDGVMPQTREAISHAKEAKVPIVVAVNKMDKPGATIDKAKQALAELDLLAEDWGGQTMFVPVSALKRTGLEELLEAINLNAEVLELRANPNCRAEGVVLESRLERGRGPVVSLLVKRGTLKLGDILVCGVASGRIRAMNDHLGQPVAEVSPGMAAEVLGLDQSPEAGERFSVPKSDSDAREVIDNRIAEIQRSKQVKGTKLSLEDLFAKIQTGSLKELKVLVKADVFGSVEAIKDNLTKLSNEKVKVVVIHAAPGGITESDVLLASASKAIILGFNVRPETKARQIAESEGIDVKCYNIIYELFDDVKKAMTGLLDKKKVEKFLGRAEVRQIFSVPKIGAVAGSSVIDGKIIRGASVRLLRDSRIVYEGKMSSLRRFKDDAKEVASGFECGIGLENFNDVKPGDLIEAYEIEWVNQDL